jgi:uncharacterized protein YjbI with pentapeptide repeats
MKRMKTQHLKNSTAALQAAIANLEKFTLKNELNPNINVADLTVQEGKLICKASSPLKKTIERARCFIAAAFSERARAKYKENEVQVRETLLKAIDTVKRNHLIIEKLKEGSLEEQRFAAATIATIERYNTVLDNAGITKAHWSKRIARFFYKFSGLSVDEELKRQRIDLPHAVSRQSNFSQQDLDNARNFECKISQAFHANVTSISHQKSSLSEAENADPILKQEADAIRIKANTLIKQHGICFQSIAEALTCVRNAPIQAVLDTESATSTLYLTLNVIPGMVIKVKGSFKRNSQPSIPSRPISDSFLLVWKSIQTGFPHPSQYTGWALADSLIPSYPHHLELLPILEPLYHRKQEAAVTLLPGGKLFEPAKQLLRLKMQVFEKNMSEWIQLHKALSIAIIEAAPADHVPKNSAEVVDAFYMNLEQQSFPLNYLMEMYDIINERAILAPHAALQEKWLNEQENFSEGAYENLTEDRKLAQEVALPSWSLDFVNCFVAAISPSSKTILLQHLSEIFRSAPPMLDDFEYKLQTAALKQLSIFLDELELNLESMPYAEALEYVRLRMRNQIVSDIALFKAPAIDEIDPTYGQIAQELEIYFNSRYYLLT